MTLEKTLRYVCIVGVFLLPFIVLYVSRSLFFPFITGKNFAFRIIVEIVAGGWLALALVNPAYRPKRTWLLWAFGAFVILIGISDIFGVYPHKSFWSNYERMEGWVTLAHLFVYFIVAQSILNTEKLWKQWWHTSLGISLLVALYALFQLLGFITINQGGIRLDATFGNATYLGVYMLFHIFIAMLYLSRAWIEMPAKRATYASLYGGLIALQSFILFFTSTRGAILGLIGGGTLAALILIFLAPRSRVAWRAGVIIASLAVLVGVFWLVSDQVWVRNIEPLHRLSTIHDEGFPLARKLNVEMALKGFKERPFFGWGQENYAPVFDKYYDPKMYAQEPWFDRVHNIIFDWLIAGGLLGLLAYLSIFTAALLSLWRAQAFEKYERAILTGLLAGYFFYLVFTFDNITSYLFFVSLLAFIAARAAPISREKLERHYAHLLPQSALPFVTACAVILVWGVAWFVNAHALAQNRAIIQGISPHAEGVTKNLEYFKKAALYNSVGNQEVREQFSQAAMSVINMQGVSQEIKQDFVKSAYDAMNALANDAPDFARFPFFMGIMLDHAGLYTDASGALQKAHELSPRKQAILFELGLNAFARNQSDEALQAFKEAYDGAPEYDDAQKYYVAALIRVGKDAEAEALLQPLVQKDGATDARIASAYAARGRYDKIAEIWSAHIAKVPGDLEARFVLAGAYYSGGNSAAALRVLEETKKIFPEAAAQTDQLIQQVKSGVK